MNDSELEIITLRATLTLTNYIFSYSVVQIFSQDLLKLHFMIAWYDGMKGRNDGSISKCL